MNTGKNTLASGRFRLRDHRAAKAAPRLLERDEAQLADVVRAVDDTLDDLSARLEAARRAPIGEGQEALDRDQEVHRLTARLRLLSRAGAELCLGRMVLAGDPEPVYVGRLGLSDRDGRRLLVDWRTPAAEAFFAATRANPGGLTSRRRYRWSDGFVTDYWDEVFTTDAVATDLGGSTASLDDDSAFLATLDGARTSRMRDVLGTLQADQDAIIRSGSRGALVVDGGPGTGKTVVALHRAAYLLHADPQVQQSRGGVLVVGPHRPFLAYVADVLPGLGEDEVRLCTLRDLLVEGATATAEPADAVARLKADARMAHAVEAAVRFYEVPPTTPMTVGSEWGDAEMTAEGWAAAFRAPDPGVPHNEARAQVWEALLDLLAEQVGEDVAAEVGTEAVRRAFAREPELRATLAREWPLLDAVDVVGDLWTVPAYLRRCAPWLDPEEVGLLQRDRPQAWTVSDLPLLDAARSLLGDPDAERRQQRQAAAAAAHRAEMDQVVEHLVAADDSEMLVMSMLRGSDLRSALADDAGGLGEPAADGLAGPFAHIVVDEAQELTDAEWQMLLRRCPSRSLTVVGDRSQARHGFTETWQERLRRVGVDRVDLRSLTVNYRTPQEVMAAAAPVIRAEIPDANVPTSVRRGGRPVAYGAASERDTILAEWLDAHPDGIACVVGDPTYQPTTRVSSLSPALCKGLEFDLVILVDPDRFGDGVTGAVDRYVAMTRATEELVVLTTR